MVEILPEPVIEIRERFTASEPLLDALVDLLDPRLTNDDTTRLRASFLFQSYRRRLKAQADYFTSEYQKDGQIKRANDAFNRLPNYQLRLATPELTVFDNLPYNRVMFMASRTADTQLPVLILNKILADIDTVEQEPIKAALGRHFYVNLDKEILGPDLEERIEALQALTSNVAQRGFYIEPDRLVTRSTVLRRSPPSAT